MSIYLHVFIRQKYLGVGGGAVRGPVGQNPSTGSLHLFCEFHDAKHPTIHLSDAKHLLT